MKRVHLPADHNHVVAEYPRTLADAFGRSSEAALVVHDERAAPATPARLALAIALWFGVIATAVAALLVQLYPL